MRENQGNSSWLVTKGAGRAVMAVCVLVASPAIAADTHPLMSSKYWVNVGAFFAGRDLDVTVNGGLGRVSKKIDLESAAGVNDQADIFTAEFGWQFGEKWDLTLQHFESDRNSGKVLSKSIEWNDLVFDVGVNVELATTFKLTRVFFARNVWEKERQSLRLGAGVHYFETSIAISGTATLEDASREFRAESVSASVPVPNVGAVYRYSPSERWLLRARADWFSANLGEYSGGIWNVVTGVDYRLAKNFGIGASYQFVQIDGAIKKTGWRGDLRSRFDGPQIYLSGFW